MKIKSKSKSVLLAIIAIVFFSSFRFQNHEKILGKWLSQDKSRKIEIYKQDKKYFGKIIGTTVESLKSKIGHVILRDLEYNPTENKFNGNVVTPDGFKATVEVFMLKDYEMKFIVKKWFVTKTILWYRST